MKTTWRIVKILLAKRPRTFIAILLWECKRIDAWICDQNSFYLVVYRFGGVGALIVHNVYEINVPFIGYG